MDWEGVAFSEASVTSFLSRLYDKAYALGYLLLESPSLLPYLNTRAHNTLHLLWSLSDSFPAISEALTSVPVLGGRALSQGPCQRLRLCSPWTDSCQFLGLLYSSPLIGLLYSMDSSVGLHFPFISDLLVLIACLNMCLSLLYISFQWTDVARISASVLPWVYSSAMLLTPSSWHCNLKEWYQWSGPDPKYLDPPTQTSLSIRIRPCQWIWTDRETPTWHFHNRQSETEKEGWVMQFKGSSDSTGDILIRIVSPYPAKFWGVANPKCVSILLLSHYPSQQPWSTINSLVGLAYHQITFPLKKSLPFPIQGKQIRTC